MKVNKPMSILQIKNCKDNDILRKERLWLVENVNHLVSQKILTFHEWEQRIMLIDLMVDKIPMVIYVLPKDGQPGYKIS